MEDHLSQNKLGAATPSVSGLPQQQTSSRGESRKTGGSNHQRFRSETVIKERPTADEGAQKAGFATLRGEGSAKRLPTIKFTPVS